MITQTLIFALLAQVSAIEGEVRDSRTHTPIPFARVELFRSQTPVTRQSTGPDGRFQFGFLPPAHYVLVVDVSGYEPTSMDFESEMSVLPMITRRSRCATSLLLAGRKEEEEEAGPRIKSGGTRNGMAAMGW